MNKRDAIGFRGCLRGHGDWVTQIATTAQYPDILVSSSRDKSLIIWELTHRPEDYGVAKRSLHGHNHFISDVVLSSDGRFALSGSWDKSLRLWDLTTCQTSKRFVGHEGDVLSVAFSADSRQIVSGSRDRTAKLWNTIGMCKYSFEEGGHSDWVSCVRFSPSVGNHTMVSCGWDKIVKVWDVKESRLADNHVGHTGYLNTVTVSPDGTLCSSGGKDGQAMLWDLNAKKFLYMLPGGGVINALCFSPNRYWLCAAIGSTIKIWDLEEKSLYEELIPENVDSKNTICTCLAWSADGLTLFAGYSDNLIRVWEIMPTDDR